MKRLFQLLAVASFGLALGSCDKSEPMNGASQGGSFGEAQRFELSSSLGSVGIEPLSSNTDKVFDDDLRATLHFKDANSKATTTLKADNFGAGKREARWGVIYDGGQYYALNCDDAVSVEPADPSNLSNNTVFFKKSATANTIEGASVKMYCKSLTSLKDITKGFMVLEGKAGTEPPNSTKQYFKGDTNPNHRIEGLLANGFQDDRHIPIMTKVVDFAEMSKPTATTKVKFAPRGSLIGLNVKNRIDTDIIVTAIVVEKAGALDYSGYFDWATTLDDKASFTADYTTAEQSQTALSFPVYADKDATEVGYTITKGNTEMPCFYIWGFQNITKLGEAFQVQIRYKTASNSTEQTTKTFNVYAPNSKVVKGTKQFDDGFSYNTTLTINSSNQTGGSNGADWNNGGTIPNGTSPNNPDFYAPESISLGTTPLDFVAEAPAVNKAGSGFVLNHAYPLSNIVSALSDYGVGYYTFDEVEALFAANKPFLANYTLPTREQWQSIVPYFVRSASVDDNRNAYVSFQKIHPKRELTEQAQVGSEAPQDYTSDYITQYEGDYAVTYAIRFKGTKWESAWRYIIYANKYVIRAVPIQGRNLSLDDVANGSFFNDNPSTRRYFPAYGYIPYELAKQTYATEINDFQVRGLYWSSTKSGTVNSLGIERVYRFGFSPQSSSVYDFEKMTKRCIRPFYKELP